MYKTSAPGKVILFGEHAVVYDRLGIAGAIDQRAVAEVTPHDKKTIILDLPAFSLKEEVTIPDIIAFSEKVQELKETGKFDQLKLLSKMPTSPIKATIGKLRPTKGFVIRLNCQLPKGTGSGSAIFSSTAAAVLLNEGKRLDTKKIIEASYEGDVVAHGGLPSGIDNNTVTHGRYLQFKKSKGPSPLSINAELPLVIVDSGMPANTGEMILKVRKQLESTPYEIERYMDQINLISLEAISALEEGNIQHIGKLINRNHYYLQKLGVSTPLLDQLVHFAIENGALGAKLTGAGGGGSIIALSKDPEKLAELYRSKGFKAFATKVGAEGVRIEREKR